MAIYQSDAVRLKKGVSGPLKAGAVIHATATVSCSAAPATTDTLEFFRLPAGATVLYAILEASDMDAGTALTINIGDAGSATRYFSGATVGQAGTTAVSTAASGINYLNTAKTLVTGTAGVNATTPSAGTVTLTILYRMD